MIDAQMIGGEPFEVFFNIKNDATTPKPIAGYTAKIELRSEREGGALIATFNDDSAEIVRNDAQGLLTLKIPSQQTIGFLFKTAVMDLWLTNGTDGVRSDSIRITLERGVTRL
jgi:hypothetical protein